MEFYSHLKINRENGEQCKTVCFDFTEFLRKNAQRKEQKSLAGDENFVKLQWSYGIVTCTYDSIYKSYAIWFDGKNRVGQRYFCQNKMTKDEDQIHYVWTNLLHKDIDCTYAGSLRFHEIFAESKKKEHSSIICRT